MRGGAGQAYWSIKATISYAFRSRLFLIKSAIQFVGDSILSIRKELSFRLLFFCHFLLYCIAERLILSTLATNLFGRSGVARCYLIIPLFAKGL